MGKKKGKKGQGDDQSQQSTSQQPPQQQQPAQAPPSSSDFPSLGGPRRQQRPASAQQETASALPQPPREQEQRRPQQERGQGQQRRLPQEQQQRGQGQQQRPQQGAQQRERGQQQREQGQQRGPRQQQGDRGQQQQRSWGQQQQQQQGYRQQQPLQQQQPFPQGQKQQGGWGQQQQPWQQQREPGQQQQQGWRQQQQPQQEQQQREPGQQQQQGWGAQQQQRGWGQQPQQFPAQQQTEQPLQAPQQVPVEQPEQVDEPKQAPKEAGRKKPQKKGAGEGAVPKKSEKEPAKRGQEKREEKKGDEKVEKFALELAEKKDPTTSGKRGRPIKLETNHLALQLGNLKSAVHYDVAFDPDRPKAALSLAMEAFRKKYYPDRHPAFDGTKNLYSSSELPFGDRLAGEVEIPVDNRNKTYKITVKFAATVDLSAIRTFLTAVSKGGRHLVTPQEAIQCVDIVLRSAPALNCIRVGRSFFTRPSGQMIDLGDGMEMYYGFYQSAILGWKPFLNVDVAHKAFPIEQNVINLIQQLFQGVPSSLRPGDISTLDKYMKTLKVQYMIPNHPSSKKVYRVNGLKGSARQTTFKLDNNKVMTIQEYFMKEKAYPLKYPDLPCLWVGSKERASPIILPAELCTVLPGQALNRKMNETQTSKMIRQAATNTDVRKKKIYSGVHAAGYNMDPVVKEFGFAVERDFEKIQGRILEPPMLLYDHNMEVKPYKGVWRNDNAKFLIAKDLLKWVIVNLDRRTNMQSLGKLSQMIVQQGCGLGMNIRQYEQPISFELPLKKELQELQQFFGKKQDYHLIIVVIPDSGPAYSFVKQAAELATGCLTQCIKAKTLYRSLNPATIGNILLKVNAKLNGVNHVFAKSVRPPCLMRPCMFMGADVTHPPPDSQNTPSVAAVTASHDGNAFKYNICWRLQPPKVEIIEDLENIAKEHLMYFFKSNNGAKPERIIFFRDGVSEGQFQVVMNTEVQAIRRACACLGDGSYQPKITFLVVQKRHHTRFFPCDPRDSHDKNCNVPAGTCVDTVITHPTAQDFYLVSHASIQGVAKPTKYRTLWDDNDMNDDELEQLTYYLCHLFTRCNRSVSYPAPTYYAHLAAARAKVYCENTIINMDNLEREQNNRQIQTSVVKDRPMFFV